MHDLDAAVLNRVVQRRPTALVHRFDVCVLLHQHRCETRVAAHRCNVQHRILPPVTVPHARFLLQEQRRNLDILRRPHRQGVERSPHTVVLLVHARDPVHLGVVHEVQNGRIIRIQQKPVQRGVLPGVVLRAHVAHLDARRVVEKEAKKRGPGLREGLPARQRDGRDAIAVRIGDIRLDLGRKITATATRVSRCGALVRASRQRGRHRSAPTILRAAHIRNAPRTTQTSLRVPCTATTTTPAAQASLRSSRCLRGDPLHIVDEELRDVAHAVENSKVKDCSSSLAFEERLIECHALPRHLGWVKPSFDKEPEHREGHFFAVPDELLDHHPIRSCGRGLLVTATTVAAVSLR